MKVSGDTILGMEKALRGIPIAIVISVSLRTAKLMVKACTVGQMEKSTMVSGTKESSKAMEYGKESKMILELILLPPLH